MPKQLIRSGQRFSVEVAWVYYGIVFVAKWFQGLIWESGEKKEPQA